MFGLLQTTITRSMKQLGGFIDFCPHCAQEQPHMLLDKMKARGVGGIDLIESESGKLMICEVCGGALGVYRKADIKTVEPWNVSIPIQVYAEKLGYDLKYPEKNVVNSRSIIALVRRIANTREKQGFPILWTALVWSLGGAAVLGLLLGCLERSGYGLFNTNDVGHQFIGACVGGILGLIVSPVWKRIRHNKSKQAEELIRYMDKLSLTYDDVKGYVDEAGAMDDKVWGLLEKVKSRELVYRTASLV